MGTDLIELACPECGRALARRGDEYPCAGCGRTYPVRGGVVRFLAREDDFYEGTYAATVNITFAAGPSLKSFLFFQVYREPYLRMVRRHLAGARTVLDLGCAGGIRFLAERAQVAGLDLSLGSLAKAAAFYQPAVQADALRLPFPDASFDLIISSYMFEHLRAEEKARLLAEARRTLRPGGRLVMQFDCDNHNPLFRRLKLDPDLYRSQIIEHDHHYGLETATVNLGRVRDAGFTVREFRALNKTPLQYLPVYQWMTPYAARSRFLGLVSRAGAAAASRRALWVPYHTLVNWWDAAAEGLFPLDYARVLLVAAERKQYP